MTLTDIMRQMDSLNSRILTNYEEQDKFFRQHFDLFKRSKPIFDVMKKQKPGSLDSVFGSYAIVSESEIFTVIINQKMVTALLGEALSTIALAMGELSVEISKNFQSSETKANDERTEKLEKELERLKKVTNKWRPYLETLKSGIEQTEKYLDENR